MGMIMKDGIPYGGIYPIDDAPTQGSNNAVKSGGVHSALSNKVDKVAGKGLSTNDYDNTEKEQNEANADAIEAIVNVNAGCNLLPCSASSQTIEGITWTVNSDGTVTASGTATANGSILVYHRFTSECVLNGKEVVLKGCPAGGGVGNYAIEGYRVAGSSSYLDNREEFGEGIKFTWNNDSSHVLPEIQLAIGANYAIQGTLTFKPMLYDARLKPTGYVPYAMTNKELTERIKEIKHIGQYTGDLNDIDETCFCYVHSTATNRPPDVTSDVHELLTIVSESANIGWGSYKIKIQLYMVNSSLTPPYIRYSYSGGWYGWHYLG